MATKKLANPDLVSRGVQKIFERVAARQNKKARPNTLAGAGES